MSRGPHSFRQWLQVESERAGPVLLRAERRPIERLEMLSGSRQRQVDLPPDRLGRVITRNAIQPPQITNITRMAGNRVVAGSGGRFSWYWPARAEKMSPKPQDMKSSRLSPRVDVLNCADVEASRNVYSARAN